MSSYNMFYFKYLSVPVFIALYQANLIQRSMNVNKWLWVNSTL